MVNKKYSGEAMLLIVTLIWGGTFAIIKTALEDISPMIFIACRFSIASLILLPFVFSSLKKINREALIGGLILGTAFFLGFVTQTAGLKHTTATKSGFITGTFILFVPLFQLLIQKQAPKKESIIGIILVLSGLIFLSSNGTTLFSVLSEIGGNFNYGDFLTLLCAFFFAFYVVYMDKVSRKVDYIPLVFMQVSVTAVGGILFALITHAGGIEETEFILSGSVIFALLYTSILATIVTTTLQTRFQKMVTPAKAGIILSFEPIFAAIYAFFMLQEKISNFGLLGCLLIFSGLLASELIGKKELAYEQ